MTEINTFSAAVDSVIARSQHPERKADIISYVRMSLRECQLRKFFKRDLTEDQISVTSENFVWEHPSYLRLLRTVQYPEIFDPYGNPIYPDEIPPGRKQRTAEYFYYGGPGYYVFAGVDANTTVNVAYYSFFKPLAYYAVTDRPAVYTLETLTWTYKTAVSDADKLIAQEAVTNWLLIDYFDTIVEGGLAKVFNSINDPRAKATFSLYKSYQNDLIAAEPAASLDM